MTNQPGIGAWIILVVTLLATGGLTLGVMWPAKKTKIPVSPLSETPETQIAADNK